MRSLVAPALVALVAAAVVPAARAHTGGSTGYASITVGRSAVRYELTLPAATLPSALAEDLRLAQRGSEAAADRLLDLVRTRVVLHGDGVRCQPGPARLEPSAFDTPGLTMRIDFACGVGVRELGVQDDTFDVLGPDHHTLARIDGAGGAQQFAFAPEARQARFVVADASRGVETTASFVAMGVHHILSGWDHLLFLLGLLLPGGGLLSLAKVITAFTLAHSVTLSLAVLHVVTLPDRLIEAVIALSIAFVAAENLVRRASLSRRWVVSFCFGLVHGFGFSSALTELGLPAQGLALSLLGFNVGVEAGQALVLAACLPLLALLRRTRWERRAVATSSAVIMVVGLALFVERAWP